MEFRCIHAFISVSVFSPDVKVNFDGLLAGPECHSISLLPSRHHCTNDGMAAVNETTNHRQQLREGGREERGREGREGMGEGREGRGWREEYMQYCSPTTLLTHILHAFCAYVACMYVPCILLMQHVRHVQHTCMCCVAGNRY